MRKMKFSNLSNKEYFYLHGELSESRLEDLVHAEEEFQEASKSLDHAQGTISEILGIAGNYMNDWNDELSSIHGEITTLKNKLRGSNKEALIKILSDLENYQHSMSNSYDSMYEEGIL